MHLIKCNGKLMQYLAGCVASMTLLAAGAVYGWVNPVLTLLESPNSPVRMTPIEASWVASLPELGTIITAVPAGFLADRVGRKNLMITVTPFTILSWIIIFYTDDVAILMAARLLQGLVIGVVSTVLPMYLSEIAEPSVRGSLGNFFVLAFTLGQVFEYALGPFVSYTTLAALTTIPSWIFLGAFYWFHESPYYLLMTGKTEEAQTSLLSFRDGAVDEELLKMKISIEEEKQRKDSWKITYQTPVGRRGMIISGVIATTVFMSGFNALISYSSSIFLKTTGMRMSSDMFTLGMGILLSASTLLGSFLLDKWGRIPTMLMSHWGSAICLFITGIYFFLLKEGYDVHTLWIIPVVGVILSPTISLFGISASKVYQPELFPTASRGFATGVNTLIFGLVSSVTILMFVPLEREGLIYVNFFIFGIFSVFGALFIQFFAPETKGKTFDEIQDLLSQNDIKKNKIPS